MVHTYNFNNKNMADLKVTRFIIDGKTFSIPEAGTSQTGLMSSNDFNKLSGIAAGAQVNVIEGVKVNGVALSIVSKIVDIIIKTGTANGNISVAGVDVPIKGLAALAYKSNVSKADLDEAFLAVINGLSDKVDTLNGTGAGSVAKAIDDAFNDFATKVTDDGVVNSYKELIDWAAAHGSDAAEMTAAITKIEGILNGIGGAGEPADVNAAIAKAISNLNIGNYYTKTETDSKFVKQVAGSGLISDTLKAKLEGIAEGATANTYSYDANTETLTLTGFAAAQ